MAEVFLKWDCCWNKIVVTPEECPFIDEGEEELYTFRKKRVLEKCLECPGMASDLKRLQENGTPFSDVLPYLIAEVHDQKARLNSMGSFLNSRTREIKFLHELGVVLQTFTRN